jgi:dUTP pyrophosphatase
MIELKDNDLVFAKVKHNAIIPTKDDENAGYDIYACFDENYMVIPSHTTKLIPTGIASATTDKYYLNVAERGSTGSKGMKYSAGIIDSSYRGEIFIAISNVNSYDIVISKLNEEELFDKYGETNEYDSDTRIIKYGDDEFDKIYEDDDPYYKPMIYPYSKAIAQLIVHEVPKMNVKEITYEELKAIPSKRGIGALGSSGK